MTTTSLTAREKPNRKRRSRAASPQIHMFYREWAVIVEIERHPEAARRLHAAEQALMSDDPQVSDAAIRDAGEIARGAPRSCW